MSTINLAERFKNIFIHIFFVRQNFTSTINLPNIHWFSEIYTCFGLQKYKF